MATQGETKAARPEEDPAMPPGAESSNRSPPEGLEAEGDSTSKSKSFSDVEKMRREIRQLQEKRAAAMMNEVVELQRERDTAVARVKILKQTLEELTMENRVLKDTVGRGDKVKQIFHLEKSLLEEQLYSSDLKKKLQSTNRQVTSLKSKLKALELQREGGALSLLRVEDESVMERSRSMTDLEASRGTGGAGEEGRGDVGAGSPPSQYHLPRLTVVKQKEPANKSGLLSPTHMAVPRPPLSCSNSPSPSPTIVPRRYKLATAQTKTVGTQVDMDPEISNTTTGTSEEVELLKHDKKVLENQLSELTAEKEKEIAEYKAREKTYKSLKTESEVLQDGLSEFSRWVRQKIQLVEEDIDVCRVIYSLHGSLSQEAAALKELQNRLGLSEQKIAQLVAENRQLLEKVKYSEEKFKQAKQQNELLQEKIVLLTPTKSSKPTYFPLTSSPRPQRPNYTVPSPPLPSLHSTSSPLLVHRYSDSKTTPTSRTSPSPPVRVRRVLYREGSSDDDSNAVI